MPNTRARSCGTGWALLRWQLRCCVGPALASRTQKKVRLGLPAQQWITVYNARKPMKQRYHYNVASTRVAQHVEKGNDDGLFVSCVACCQELWALIMDAGTGFTSQMFHLSTQFLPKDWIMERWEASGWIGASVAHVVGSPHGALRCSLACCGLRVSKHSDPPLPRRRATTSRRWQARRRVRRSW